MIVSNLSEFEKSCAQDIVKAQVKGYACWFCYIDGDFLNKITQIWGRPTTSRIIQELREVTFSHFKSNFTNYKIYYIADEFMVFIVSNRKRKSQFYPIIEDYRKKVEKTFEHKLKVYETDDSEITTVLDTLSNDYSYKYRGKNLFFSQTNKELMQNKMKLKLDEFNKGYVHNFTVSVGISNLAQVTSYSKTKNVKTDPYFDFRLLKLCAESALIKAKELKNRVEIFSGKPENEQEMFPKGVLTDERSKKITQVIKKLSKEKTSIDKQMPAVNSYNYFRKVAEKKFFEDNIGYLTQIEVTWRGPKVEEFINQIPQSEKHKLRGNFGGIGLKGIVKMIGSSNTHLLVANTIYCIYKSFNEYFGSNINKTLFITRFLDKAQIYSSYKIGLDELIYIADEVEQSIDEGVIEGVEPFVTVSHAHSKELKNFDDFINRLEYSAKVIENESENIVRTARNNYVAVYDKELEEKIKKHQESSAANSWEEIQEFYSSDDVLV